MLKKTLAMTAVLATAWLAGPLAAQTTDFPNKPVRIVVPFPPGGATDITARVVAEKLSTKWGQPVVIDNKAGAGGNVGSDLVAKSAPDGYNIVLGVTGSHSINIALYKKMPYHPLNDFEPLTQATIYPNAIVVNPQVPANTLPELIALLKNAKLEQTRKLNNVVLEKKCQFAKDSLTDSDSTELTQMQIGLLVILLL